MIAKVCGLTAPGEVAMVLAAGADLLGFLHHGPSPRHCPDLALARRAGERGVLVTVPGDLEALAGQVRVSGAPWVQPYLPAPLRAEGLRRLRELGVKILLPWPDEPGQEPLGADLYLWESSPRATGLPGGSGQGHPMAHPPPGPFLLGGGLCGEAVPERLGAMPPSLRGLCRGFDAASRLAHSGGAGAPSGKDPARVKAFIQAARHPFPDPCPGSGSQPSFFRSDV